jgi:hypothetical protein
MDMAILWTRDYEMIVLFVGTAKTEKRAKAKNCFSKKPVKPLKPAPYIFLRSERSKKTWVLCAVCECAAEAMIPPLVMIYDSISGIGIAPQPHGRMTIIHNFAT